MKITFLGTGTSQGVPVIGCKCKTCQSNDSHDKRLRSSVLINIDNINLVIDAGPDFRQQMLRENVEKLDAVILTHPHKDHIGGLDDVRAFNYLQKKPMDVYIKQEFIKAVENEFFYAFEENKYPGVPQINLQPINNTSFHIKNIGINPISILHYKMEILGFRINDFTYITDASYISDEEAMKTKNSKILVINGIRKKEHYAHFNISQAIEFINKVNPEKAYITHISHMLEPHSQIQNELPDNIYLAHDRLKIEI